MKSIAEYLILMVLASVSCSNDIAFREVAPKEITFGIVPSKTMVGGTEGYLRDNGFEVMVVDNADRSRTKYCEHAGFNPLTGRYHLNGCYWPSSQQDESYDFHAASTAGGNGISFSYVGSEPQIEFSRGALSPERTEGRDVIIASTYGCDVINSGSGVALNFKHILSCLSEIRFRLEDDSADIGAKVKSIEISCPYSYTYHFDCAPDFRGGRWTRNSGSCGVELVTWEYDFNVLSSSPAAYPYLDNLLLIPANMDYGDGPYYDVCIVWEYFRISTGDYLCDGYGYLTKQLFPSGRKTILSVSIPTVAEKNVGADLFIEEYEIDTIGDLEL